MSHAKTRLPLVLLSAAIVLFGIQFVKADETKPMVRIICATGLSEEHKIVLASKSEDGKWKELATVALRSSLVSEWLPAQTGELHLMEKKDGEKKSIGRFTFPAGASRALLALTANKEEGTYTVHALDPKKEGYVKGTTLILNLSQHTGIVNLGADKLTLEAGKHVTAKPTTDENGMHPMLISYLDNDKNEVPCYDRIASSNPNTRKIILLLPDSETSLRVISLSEFGPFE